MIDVRPFNSLGRFSNDWLNANYHFSFAGYDSAGRRGWGALRVWNDDTIKAQTGFGRHPHRDMEIITYVRKGAITHRDSLGNGGRTTAGDVQVMSAGSGIFHEEWNEEDTDTQIFQIWIEPRSRGGDPFWETRSFPAADREGAFIPLASGQAGLEGASPIRQDATLYGATLEAGQSLSQDLDKGRYGYLVLARGSVRVNGTVLKARDGAAIKDEPTLTVEALEEAEILFVDAPA